MKLDIDGSSVMAAIEAVAKLAPPTTGNVTLAGSGKAALITSMADVSFVKVKLTGKVIAEGEVALPLQGLKDAAVGHEQITMVHKNASLRVSAEGGYEASLATVDVVPLDDTEEDAGTTVKLNTEQAEWILGAAKAVNMKPTALLNAFMPIAVSVTSKGTLVTCYDTNHVSWTKSADVKGDFEAVFPATTLISILEVMKGVPFEMSVSSSRITVKSKVHAVSISIPNVTEGMPSIAEVKALIKSAAANDMVNLSLKKDSALKFFTNARAVAVKERAEVHIVGAKSAVNMAVSTVAGRVKASVEGSSNKACDFKIDYDYLTEMISKSGADVEIGLCVGQYVFAKLPACNTLISLNQ